MNKRISLVNECTLLCEVVFVLTESQREKLESGKLREKIDHIAMDMHVCWSVEVNNNIATGLIGKECGPVIDSDTMHQIEIAATNFMSMVDKLEIPEDQPMLKQDLINFDTAEEGVENLEFVKKLLNDMNLPSDDDHHVWGALIIDTTTHPFCPELTGWGHMSYDLLKEMCQLYIKVYDHEYANKPTESTAS